ncbi:MAG: Flp pilus assembly protein CpaB [Alphaproteobacteria bacterium]|nr:Flp pilus assembly protein CpaB [Alphaproteobacteria bacterium]
MSPVRLIILVVAAGAAIGAVFLVRSAQAPSPADAAVSTQPAAQEVRAAKEVLVAKRELPVGQFVVLDDLQWQGWPENAPTPSFIVRKDDPEALEKMVGAVSRTALVVGEPITAAKLVHPGDQGFMAAVLTPGMRAVSIEISTETAAGGFILPNDKVDVFLTREFKAEEGSQAEKNIKGEQILDNVRVLAIDTTYQAATPEGAGQAIAGTRATLELSSEDAGLIVTAEKAGNLSLILRSIADLQSRSGGTQRGRALRNNGGDGQAETVRVYRYGTQSATAVPAG